MDGDSGSPEAAAALDADRLPRRLGSFTATSVVVANMVGTGILTTSGLMLERLDSAGLVLLCWISGGVVAICGALSYAELAAMMPRAGGEYVYLRAAYGPLAAFLSGWVSFFVGFSAPIAATSVACARYLAVSGSLRGQHHLETGIALTIVAALTALHARGLRAGAVVQNVLTGLKVVLLGAFVVAGFGFGHGSWSFLQAPGGGLGTARFGQIGIAMLWVMFAFSGWNASAYLAEEVKDPERSLPRSLAIGTSIVTAIYLALNLLYLFAAPASALRGAIAVGEVAARGLFGEAAARWLSVLAAVLLLSSLSAYVLIGPRVYYAMARDGLFFRFAARVHPRFRTPAASIALQGLCAAIMVASGSFEQILTYIGFALGIFPWLAVLAVPILRRRLPAADRPYRVRAYPWIPLVYLAAGAAILCVAFVNRPIPSLLAILTVAAGIPAYRLALRPGGPPNPAI